MDRDKSNMTKMKQKISRENCLKSLILYGIIMIFLALIYTLGIAGFKQELIYTELIPLQIVK